MVKLLIAGEIMTALEALEKNIKALKLEDQKFHIVKLDVKFVKN